jgi:hypothetical protein
MKDNFDNVSKIGCSVLLIYFMFIISALVCYVVKKIEPSSWFEVKLKPQSGVVQGNCDSLLQKRCDSLGIDYNTIGTTTDPD